MRAANPQVLSRHLVLGIPCGLPTRRYFQGIWCLESNPQVHSRHLVLEMPCGLPTRRYLQQVLSRHLVLGMPCGLPTCRYFQGIWCLECPAGCQPAATFKAVGAWNALRAANPQVLSRHLVLEMPCRLPTRRYFQGIQCLKCTAGCQPAALLSRHLVLEMLLRAASPQVLSRQAFGAWNACRLPSRRYYQGIWCLKCPAGCQPAGISRHLVFDMILRNITKTQQSEPTSGRKIQERPEDSRALLPEADRSR